MEDNKPNEIVPDQEKGASTNSEHSYEASSMEEAKAFYREAKSRFTDINSWEQYSGTPSAAFVHTDEKGSKVSRDIQVGDHFRINIPGPGTVSGEGYDWVQVEEVIDKSNETDDQESIAIRVRPAENPANEKHDVAHFFSGEATSNFVLRREKNKVTAGVYGRNEVPNTEAENLIDKARNATIGISASAGVSNIQWKKLVKGIIGK